MELSAPLTTPRSSRPPSVLVIVVLLSFVGLPANVRAQNAAPSATEAGEARVPAPPATAEAGESRTPAPPATVVSFVPPPLPLDLEAAIRLSLANVETVQANVSVQTATVARFEALKEFIPLVNLPQLAVAFNQLGGPGKVLILPDVTGGALLEGSPGLQQASLNRANLYFPLAPSGHITALPIAEGGKGRVSRVHTDIDTFLSEVNLLSTGKGPFNWVVGAFYLDETVGVLSQRDTHHTDDFYYSSSTFQTSAANTTKSAFGQINWFVTQPIELVAGVRYSDDRQVYNRIIPAGPTPPGVSRIGVEHSTQWTGKLGINYHIGNDLLYVTASQGYKQGGVNLTLGTPNFGPEKNRVYEGGFKTQWLSNRLRVNGDVFYSQYRDIQLASLLGGLPITQNAARGKAYGAELEVTGQFGGLLFNAGGGYLHARFDGDSCITDTNAPGTDPGCGTNLRLVPDGGVLPFSPKWTINAGVQYEILIGGDSSLTPRVQWSHLSSQYATPFPSVNTLVPSHDVFDAKLTYSINDRYSIQGFVDNLTDKVYIASQIQNSSSADGGIIYGAPRTYGVRVIAKF